ncbi:hypothetical protein GCM10011409_09270 [Lentibacillus populi]|uniref:Uncharacterized protein n=1 Tax=Lentibacillus populi TaxID=1827502 RepID=A0A9W5X4Q5_9BACI|nr:MULTISPECIES: hypothetical protein [Bacillaceae]MBT2214329.1 hypothetical protein [Virgibacillus dakarensis]GGB33971.1 hypothetical protein GCM10011409_09270 [Lentibacillus populi]
MPRKAAILTEHSYAGDKGNTVSWGLQDAGQFGVATGRCDFNRTSSFTDVDLSYGGEGSPLAAGR